MTRYLYICQYKPKNEQQPKKVEYLSIIGDNVHMDSPDTFKTALFSAFDEKLSWYDTVEMARLLTEYRNFHAHVENLLTTLLNKGSISSDPYKHDKKISDIEVPEESFYNESERNVVIGTRLSDFESILDFLCNYFKFSIATFTVDRIKKLIALNNVFQWNSLVTNSTKPNSRGLAECLVSIRQGTDTLTISVINDSISNAAKCVGTINTILKEITDFQREVYKIEVRKSVFEHPSFRSENLGNSISSHLQQIKKMFPAVMGKQPFYTELIEEILQEDLGADKEERRKALLSKLEVKKVESVKKEKEIDTKEILMDAVRTLTGIVPQFEQILVKIDENKKVLDSEQTSMWVKFSALVRKAFKMTPLPVFYRLNIVDVLTKSQRTEVIEFDKFYSDLQRRIRYYISFSLKKTPGYQKLEALSDDKIVEFLITQLSECQKTMILLNALDDYYKTTVTPANLPKIRGIKMEMTAVKNTLVKTNQRKAEYSTIVEEQEQMKKLGIIHA